ELAARTALLGLLCAAAGLAFLILGAVALRRSVLAPISRLRRSLEDGTEAPAVALDGGGEVDALARAVSVVTTRLGEDRDRAREAREALEREVALRTAAVADANARLTTELRQRHEIEEELRRAKERAEAASRAKSQFLASISHELRTPLNAVIGFAQLLERQTFGPLGDGRYVQYAGDIESSGSHLLEMINDILDIARIEAGELVLALYRTELAPLVRAARRNCAERAKHKRITIESRLAEAPIALDLDRARVVQVLDELLDNAIKHTPEGGAVTVMVAALSEGGAEVVIADTGIGLAANDVATALALFEQVDASFARRHQGAGLGLPLSQRLVDLHGGTLSITGAPGAGTIVRLVWPAPAAEAAA
ncbi:MAG: hypothetical protein FJX56_14405, partial [Alphaproteobacteria bacterium]|nr:hypothetical protein [Alphaproteobacteria bacterium]